MLTPFHKVTCRQRGTVFAHFIGSAQPPARSDLQGRDAIKSASREQRLRPTSRKKGCHTRYPAIRPRVPISLIHGSWRVLISLVQGAAGGCRSPSSMTQPEGADLPRPWRRSEGADLPPPRRSSGGDDLPLPWLRQLSLPRLVRTNGSPTRTHAVIQTHHQAGVQ